MSYPSYCYAYTESYMYAVINHVVEPEYARVFEKCVFNRQGEFS